MVYCVIFGILILGSLTMVYPFMLMLTGSTRSQADSIKISPYPDFWSDDMSLFQKYVESKYNADIEDLEIRWQKTLQGWDKIKKPSQTEFELLDDFLEWRSQCRSWRLGHARSPGVLPINGRKFRKLIIDRYDGNLDAFRKDTGELIKSWSDLLPPPQGVFRFPPQKEGVMRIFLEFAQTMPVEDRMFDNADGDFWIRYLLPTYTSDIEQYNKAHGTKYSSYKQVFLSRRVPEGGPERKDWEEYVRNTLSLQCIRLLPELNGTYCLFLSQKYDNDISEYNTRHGSSFKTFNQIMLSLDVPEKRIEQVDWEAFLRDRDACPAEGVEVYSPRQEFEEFMAARRGVPASEVEPLNMPIAAADWHDCMADTSQLRWEFTTRNYKQVLDYLLLHGSGIRNTVIYCSLAIILALLVNPLAAYALSRYKPPSTYKILLLCMATMAFPGEVTMIPAFLLLKRFPLWPLLGGSAAFGLGILILARVFKKLPEATRLTIALGMGIFTGGWVVPALMPASSHISLLNTFAAMVLPGMANGYSIFLLKGFFDSLPRELYEAADLDGAGEWTKFWVFTMNLSKPILAVIALGAFTGAYSQFMMALIIIPDQNMWTIMVWLFQLQSQAHQSVVYAALVIGAIPTFIVFVLCQGIIMKGIVVPIEK